MHADWIVWSRQVSSSEMSSLYSSRSMFCNGESVFQNQPPHQELVAALNPQQSAKLLGSDIGGFFLPGRNVGLGSIFQIIATCSGCL
jgi:hypothetical protein